MSPDGVYYPMDPGEFMEEVASELYRSQGGLAMDTALLLGGGAWGRSVSQDTPDFCSQILALLDPGVLSTPVGGPASVRELTDLLGHGSEATSTDELPRCVLRLLEGFGVHALHSLLASLHYGATSVLLSTVLHLPLKKKEPSWLLRNSLLEPFVRRVEASVVFRRSSAGWSWPGAFRPPCSPTGGRSAHSRPPCYSAGSSLSGLRSTAVSASPIGTKPTPSATYRGKPVRHWPGRPALGWRPGSPNSMAAFECAL